MRRLGLIGTVLLGLLAGCGVEQQPVTEKASASRQSAKLLGSVTAANAATGVYSVSGYRANYLIAHQDGVVTVTSKVDSRDVHVFQAPKLIKFVDRWTSFDIDGTPGQIYRLYQAAFNRKPDHAGLGFWIKANQDGSSLAHISGNFIGSAEFRTAYGEHSSPGVFIDALYRNILHREGEAGGFDWWVQQVSNGLDRSAVLIGFADSKENSLALMPDMENGFDFVPHNPGGPIAPRASSYENKMLAFAAVGPVSLPTFANGEVIGAAYALADFLQDGSYTMVAATANFSREYTDGRGTPEKPAKLHFFQRVNGTWVDISARLLSDQTGCISARKAIVADFNGDGKPDVFLACHGYDAEPFPGENQRVLLSHATGYRNVEIAINCFCHGAAAADFSGNGYADILLADQMVARTPYFLINNRDGSFKADKTRFPSGLMYKLIWTAELVDTTGTGRFDAFLAGADPAGDGYQIAPTIFRNDGQNGFHHASTTIQMLPSAGDKFGHGVTLDAIFDRDKVYLLRTFNYASMAVQKTSLSTGASSEIYAHSGSYHPTQNTQNWHWFPWIGFAGNRVVATEAMYDAKADK